MAGFGGRCGLRRETISGWLCPRGIRGRSRQHTRQNQEPSQDHSPQPPGVQSSRWARN
jgi:hypothetical protein